MNAANLRIAEQYVKEFGNLARTGTSMIIPTDLSDIAGMVKSAQAVLHSTSGENGHAERATLDRRSS